MEKKYGSVRKINYDDDIHCYPNDDWFEHIPDANCECSPKLDEQNRLDRLRWEADKCVFIHNQIKYSKGELN